MQVSHGVARTRKPNCYSVIKHPVVETHRPYLHMGHLKTLQIIHASRDPANRQKADKNLHDNTRGGSHRLAAEFANYLSC